jgi:hypothetical protein
VRTVGWFSMEFPTLPVILNNMVCDGGWIYCQWFGEDRFCLVIFSQSGPLKCKMLRRHQRLKHDCNLFTKFRFQKNLQNRDGLPVGIPNNSDPIFDSHSNLTIWSDMSVNFGMSFVIAGVRDEAQSSDTRDCVQFFGICWNEGARSDAMSQFWAGRHRSAAWLSYASWRLKFGLVSSFLSSMLHSCDLTGLPQRGHRKRQNLGEASLKKIANYSVERGGNSCPTSTSFSWPGFELRT